MQFYKYFLILIPVSFTAIAILNKSRSVTAHSPEIRDRSQDLRVGFNPQMVRSLGAVNRAQQAYYFEQAKFAKNLQELGEVSIALPDNDNYKLNIKSEDSTSFIYGIPQQKYGKYKQWSGSRWENAEEPLYAYVSAIAYFKETGSFQSILCVSKAIGGRELAQPKIVDSKFICPRDTEEIR